jgi:hypothetical protein
MAYGLVVGLEPTVPPPMSFVPSFPVTITLVDLVAPDGVFPVNQPIIPPVIATTKPEPAVSQEGNTTPEAATVKILDAIANKIPHIVVAVSLRFDVFGIVFNF